MVPVIRVNANGSALTLPDGAGEVLRAVPHDQPIAVLIHGFKYSPRAPGRDPHRSVLGSGETPACGRSASWPRRLGLGRGLVVGFGWHGTGTIWAAQASAARAGSALAALVRTAGRPVDVVAHSLGARVALAAIAELPAGAISRAILISGAELRSRAAAVLATPGGRAGEIVNVCSRENDLFDALYESFVAPHRPFDRAIGAGLGTTVPNWLDLQLDAAEVRRGLGRLGFDIPAPDRRVCHWSGYLRSGTWPLYRALIEDRLPLAALRRVLPDGLEPRWARLFDGFKSRDGLPPASSAPS
jgi:pimeloyl-ACP methyl ester carboxylesterase